MTHGLGKKLLIDERLIVWDYLLVRIVETMRMTGESFQGTPSKYSCHLTSVHSGINMTWMTDNLQNRGDKLKQIFSRCHVSLGHVSLNCCVMLMLVLGLVELICCNVSDGCGTVYCIIRRWHSKQTLVKCQADKKQKLTWLKLWNTFGSSPVFLFFA